MDERLQFVVHRRTAGGTEKVPSSSRECRWWTRAPWPPQRAPDRFAYTGCCLVSAAWNGHRGYPTIADAVGANGTQMVVRSRIASPKFPTGSLSILRISPTYSQLFGSCAKP
jgi:hypothetical protein